MLCTTCIVSLWEFRLQTKRPTTFHCWGDVWPAVQVRPEVTLSLQPGRPGQSHSRPPPERMRAQLHVNSILLFILGSEIVISTEVNRELGQNVPVQGSHTVKPEILSACVCVGGWYKPSNRI